MGKTIYSYNGQIYKSLLQLSEAVDINRRTLTRLINENKDKSIDDLVSEYKSQKILYTYKGTTYQSIEEAAKAFNLYKTTLAKYLRLAENDLEKALQLYEDEHTYAVIDGIRYHTQADLADYLQVTVTKLSKYIEKEGSIENAVKKIQRKEEEKETYTWRGKTYPSFSSLSRAMDIVTTTLRKYLKETNGNLDEAYLLYQERNSGKSRGCTYNGKHYSSKRTALKELGISNRQYYQKQEELGNDFEKIVNAILKEKEEEEITKSQKAKEKELRQKQIKTYIYDGKEMKISEIVEKAGLSATTLRHLLSGHENQNVDDIIHDHLSSKIVYTFDGKQFDSIKALAEHTNIRDLRLGRYIRKYDRDANKTIFMIRLHDLGKTKTNYGGKNISYSDLAIILGIKKGELVNYLIRGGDIQTLISKLRTKNPSQKKDENLTKRLPTMQYNGMSLHQYCINNGINYNCIYYRIKLGASIEEALDDYNKNGQRLPPTWIYEKYGVLLKHLLLNEKIDSKKVVSIMRNKLVSFQEAIEEYIIKDEAKKNKLNPSWQMELYDILASENIPDEEKEQFKKEFYVSSDEEKCINQSKDRTAKTKRKILLFEFAECMHKNIFPENEMIDLLKIYNISEQEIETIFLDLYCDFYQGVKLSDGQEMMQNKRLLKNSIKSYDSMDEDEKKILESQFPDDIDFIRKTASNIAFYKNAIKVKQLNRNDIGKIGAHIDLSKREDGEAFITSIEQSPSIEGVDIGENE